jgi:hypothetical protein
MSACHGIYGGQGNWSLTQGPEPGVVGRGGAETVLGLGPGDVAGVAQDPEALGEAVLLEPGVDVRGSDLPAVLVAVAIDVVHVQAVYVVLATALAGGMVTAVGVENLELETALPGAAFTPTLFELSKTKFFLTIEAKLTALVASRYRTIATLEAKTPAQTVGFSRCPLRKIFRSTLGATNIARFRRASSTIRADS